MFVCAQKKCFIHFWQSEKGTTLRCFKALLKQLWAFRNGGSSFRLPVVEAGDNNKNKLDGKKQQRWSKVFGEGDFFIDLMVQTIKFYIGQRVFTWPVQARVINSVQQALKQREWPRRLIELARLIVRFPGVR